MKIEDPADDPEVLLDKSERRDAIRGCLSQLSAAQREVIDLVYYHQKSVGDVAKIVGVPATVSDPAARNHHNRLRPLCSAIRFDANV